MPNLIKIVYLHLLFEKVFRTNRIIADETIAKFTSRFPGHQVGQNLEFQAGKNFDIVFYVFLCCSRIRIEVSFSVNYVDL